MKTMKALLSEAESKVVMVAGGGGGKSGWGERQAEGSYAGIAYFLRKLMRGIDDYF